MNRQDLTRVGLVTLALVTLGAFYRPQPLLAGPTPINALPFTITAPGTYCVTQNLTAGPGVSGIDVFVGNVVIDLGGFLLLGSGAATPFNAIQASSSDVEVRNGTIANWGLSGISLGNAGSVSDVQVSNCVEEGIVTGHHANLRNCKVFGTFEVGISTLHYANITECAVRGTPNSTGVKTTGFSTLERVVSTHCDDAFDVGDSSRLDRCTAADYLVRGFVAGEDCTLIDCGTRVAGTQAQSGFEVGDHGHLERCTVSGGVIVGIRTGRFCSLVDTRVKFTDLIGVSTGDGTRLTGCTITNCNRSESFEGAGVVAQGNAIITDSTLAENSYAGLRALNQGGTVARNAIFLNAGHGMTLQDGVRASENWVAGNTGIGIWVLGDRAHLENNTVDANDRGIQVLGKQSLIIDNRAARNAIDDFELPYGNTSGPVIKSGWTIGGSTPQANFETPHGT